MPSKYDLGTEHQDLEVFSPEEDLFSESSTQVFNSVKLSKKLDMSAERAKKVCDAQTQLMLAKLESDEEKAIDLKDKAQHIAFELGLREYLGLSQPENPFEDPSLKSAWDYGYTTAATQKKTQQHADIERKVWEEGIDTENQNSQFELAAVSLYNIALNTDSPEIATRANLLAMEMCCYNEGQVPTEKRQAEINRFMALQSERLIKDIDFI